MLEFVQILIGGVLVGATYALIALGLSLVYRVTGVINLAQGAFCLLGALLAWTLETGLGWSAAPAALAAIAATTAIGILVGAATFVPGLARLSNANMLMLTAGLLTLAEGAFAGGVGQPALRPAAVLRRAIPSRSSASSCPPRASGCWARPRWSSSACGSCSPARRRDRRCGPAPRTRSRRG